MPLGAFKLNSISKPPSQNLGARSAVATLTSNSTFDYVATPKYGTNSLSTTSTLDRTYTVTVNPSDSTWYFNSNKPWTVEFYVYAADRGNEHVRTMFSMGPSLGQGDFNYSDNVQNGTYQYNFQNSTTYLSDTFPSNGDPQTGTWYHLALVSNGSTIKHFANGVQNYSGSASQTSNRRAFNFGHKSASAVSTLYFDEVRVSNIARYTSAFTPPSAAFTNDANTLALFHLNGSNSDDIS